MNNDKKFLRKATLQYTLIVIGLFILNSCKNELKLNAPYKEIPSVYAVMNPNEPIQMIRINKVFLGEGDANTMAQVADSINYPAGELTVTLERTSYGKQDLATPTPNGHQNIIIFRDSVIEAKAGAFSKTQRVYVTSDRLFGNGDYKLTIKNNRSGNVFTSRTTAIDSIKGNQSYRPLTPPYYPYLPTPNNPNDFVDYATGNNDGGSIRFAPNGGTIYQMTIRFHFYDSLFNQQKTYNYVDYNFGTRNIKDAENTGSQGSFIIYSFKKADMFSAVGVGLSKLGLSNDIIGRKMYKIQYLVYSSTQEYIDYMQYVSPSLSIAQVKPLYSNFDNQAALGIFTFRTRCSVYKELASAFVSEFAYNDNSCRYQFLTAGGSKPGCKN